MFYSCNQSKIGNLKSKFDPLSKRFLPAFFFQEIGRAEAQVEVEQVEEAEVEAEAESPNGAADSSGSPGWLRPAVAASLLLTGLAAGWLTHAQLRPANLESVMERALELDIVNGAVQLCQQTPQEPDCLLIQESVAQLRPADFRANYEAAFALAAHGADLKRAEGYSERAGKVSR